MKLMNGNYVWRTCTPAGPWIGVVFYAYAHSQHMLDYVLSRAAIKQEQWDDRWRYGAIKERD